MGAVRAAIKDHLFIGICVAQEPEVRGLKRLQAVAVGLGHIPCRLDLVVQDGQNAPARRLGRRRHSDAIDQVHIRVGAQAGGRTHGAGNHDGFAALDSQVQEIGGFLQSGSPVGDRHARGIRIISEYLVDPVRQSQPVLRRDISAPQIQELLGPDVGKLQNFRHPGQKFIDRQMLTVVAVVRVVRAGTPYEGDTSTCPHQVNLRLALTSHIKTPC